MVFQALRHVLDGAVGGKGRGFNPFQGISGFAAVWRFAGNEIFRGFNPFQGISGFAAAIASMRAVSGIAFQSLSGYFKLCGRAGVRVRAVDLYSFNPFQGISGFAA